MITNHGTLITFGSRYGSAEHYARKFAELTGYPLLPYREAKDMAGYERIIHFGALYAGGVLGLRQIVSLLSAKTELIIVTVGLADVGNNKNIKNIRRSVQTQLPTELFRRARIFHLRGAINYGKLNFVHRTMMRLLYAKAKKTQEQNAETEALIETYGKKISFVNDEDLIKLKNAL